MKTKKLDHKRTMLAEIFSKYAVKVTLPKRSLLDRLKRLLKKW
jgi:hypothetical protein